MNSDDRFLPISPCTVLRITGADRERFINGQVSNDVRGTADRGTVFNAVLNGKGQLEGVCWIREHEDAYLLDAPLDLRESLPARLDRYLIADDVAITDESEQWHLAHVLGKAPAAPELLVYASNRLGVPGYDVLSPTPFALPGYALLEPDAAAQFRIDQGVPAWGAELTAGLLPPEAGLDATAISYDKGCYLGQEVISRIKRAGKTNRHLVQLEVPAGLPVPTDLLHDGALAGTITSVSPVASDGRSLALGFRKRKYEEIADFAVGDDRALVKKRLAGTK